MAVVRIITPCHFLPLLLECGLIFSKASRRPHRRFLEPFSSRPPCASPPQIPADSVSRNSNLPPNLARLPGSIRVLPYICGLKITFLQKVGVTVGITSFVSLLSGISLHTVCSECSNSSFPHLFIEGCSV